MRSVTLQEVAIKIPVVTRQYATVRTDLVLMRGISSRKPRHVEPLEWEGRGPAQMAEKGNWENRPQDDGWDGWNEADWESVA